MTDEPRDRAIRVALALLHQPNAADAAGAWQVLGKLGRVGAELRGAIEGASSRGLRAPLEPAPLEPAPLEPAPLEPAPGPGPGPAVEPWSAAAIELAQRLDQAAACWSGRSGFPWATWDESSAVALGSLLRELDALAATLLAAANSDIADRPARPRNADPGRRHRRGHGADGHGPWPHRHPRPHWNPRPRPRRMSGGRLIPSIALATAAVVGVIGGITVAATQVSRIELPSRSILSEPVPYTLHDSGGGAVGKTAKPGRPQGAGTGGTGAAAASQNPSSAASPAGSPDASASPAARSGAAPASRQSSKIPQPREAGFRPPSRAYPDPDQLGNTISDARSRAEQLQEEQLRELAQQMEAAMGLAIGLNSR